MADSVAPGIIGFRKLVAADLPMVADWLDRPHWRPWWGEPAEEYEINREMGEGADRTEPYVILLDGRDAGYIQMWHIDDYRSGDWLLTHPWLAELPEDCVGVDLSLANASDLGRGIGQAALREFVSRLVERGFREIVIDPDPENLRAVNAYRKAGFEPVPHLEGRTGDSLIMKCDLKQYGIRS